MAVVTPNIWYLNDIGSVNNFLAQGGRVVLITETADPYLKGHPLCVPASILLPPYDVVSLELDGQRDQADAVYCQYLQSEEPDMYICAILASVINNIPVGLYFGQEDIEVRFSMAFLNYLFLFYGLAVGNQLNGVAPAINIQFMPLILNKLYMLNLVSFQQFMSLYPDMPIDPNVIPKMVYDVDPPVKNKENIQEYYDHFEWIRKNIFKNNGNYLRFPLVSEARI